MPNRVTWLTVLLAVLAAGCSTSPALRRALTAPYHPTNVYLRQPTLPPELRRVAVLPVCRTGQAEAQTDAAALLEPVFLAELGKRNLFEVIPVALQDMPMVTGGLSWTAEDKLPADFFARLRQKTGCEAVLFVSLTSYQAYPPLRTGWKARLVDGQHQQTWWAVDETFDAGVESVAVAAEAYARSDLNLPNPLLADTGVLHSPRRFGQYTAHAVLATLPGRENPPKSP